jgi:tetratricopeptide (TPR) repeat protein
MIRLFLVGSLLFLCAAANAQSYTIDSLRMAVSKEMTDSGKVLFLDELARAYPETQTDSILAIEYRGLTLARKIGFSSGQALILLDISKALYRIGNLPKALNAALESLRIQEAKNNLKSMAWCYAMLGTIYNAQNDNRKELFYSLAEKQVNKMLGEDSKNWAASFNLSTIYLKLNQADSALFYLRDAYKIAIQKKDIRTALILAQFGDIYEKLGDSGSALNYYRLGFRAAVANGLSAAASIAGNLASFFAEKGKVDSSIFYAKIAFNKANSVSTMQQAAMILSKQYEKKDLAQSYHYYKIAVSAKDSMFSIEKINELQKLTAEEELHRQEVAEQIIKEAEARKKAIRIAGISIFLPLFFLVVFLLGRMQIKPRFIEFMGILSLLFVFEFVTLLLHPFIEKWTDHDPILMLLILVAIAAFLVPMHHRIERWMKEHLVHKPSKKMEGNSL